MRTTASLGLAALLLAAAAAPAAAQTGYGSQAYPPSSYDRGSSGYQPAGRPAPYGSDARSGAADRAESYGQPDRYDQGQDQGGGDEQAEDPQALARQLNLSPSQQGAFDAYRRAFQPDEARMRQEEAEMRRMASLTTPQRLDAARAAQTRDRADFDRTEAATRAFYAQLNPTQRRSFDQLTAPQMDDEGGQDGPGGPSPTQPSGRPQR